MRLYLAITRTLFEIFSAFYLWATLTALTRPTT
jgi:hypothetical protein